MTCIRHKKAIFTMLFALLPVMAIYSSNAFAAERSSSTPFFMEDPTAPIEQPASEDEILSVDTAFQEKPFAFSDTHPLKTAVLQIDTDGVFTFIAKGKLADYELFIIPQECVPVQERVRTVIAEGTCDQLLTFTVSQAGGYDFSLLSKSILVFANCSRFDRDCSTHPDDIRVLYASKPFEKNENARRYPLDTVVNTEWIPSFVQMP